MLTTITRQVTKNHFHVRVEIFDASPKFWLTLSLTETHCPFSVAHKWHPSIFNRDSDVAPKGWRPVHCPKTAQWATKILCETETARSRLGRDLKLHAFYNKEQPD
jgi:hypothetical protein